MENTYKHLIHEKGPQVTQFDEFSYHRPGDKETAKGPGCDR
jgi:hypothetical protein